MIAAYQGNDEANVDIALTDDWDKAQTSVRLAEKARLHREVCALFVRRLEMPQMEPSPWEVRSPGTAPSLWREDSREAHAAYDKAIELAHSKEYQQARRSLFDWEDQAVANDWPTATAITDLEHRVDTHNDLIKSKFRKTWIRRTYRVVQLVSPPLIALATADQDLSIKSGVQLAAAGLLKLVEARLPAIEDPNASPGAALHQAISVMSHEDLHSRRA
jgi:hypothetical protein